MSGLRWLPVVLLGLLLGACGDEPGLDVTRVEAYLVDSQATTYGDLDLGDASCPDKPLVEGMRLTCTLEVAEVAVPYVVRLRDVRKREVRIDVALDAVVLLEHRIADYVVGTMPEDFADAEVSCDHEVVLADVGDTVECSLSSGGQSNPVKVTVEDDTGRVSIA
jgi:hypothetical protein